MKHTTSRTRKWLRRSMYLFLTLLIIWAVAVQSGCFTMRTPDREWPSALQKSGQTIAPQFIDLQAVCGRTVHAVAIGAADSLPLTIMAHGSPGASDAFLNYLGDTAISRVTRMVSVDRPGFGYTSGFGKPEPSQAAQASALKCIADYLAPGQKVFLVGHSLGGPVIARFAMDYPELTAGLVIVAGSIDPGQEEHPWWQSAIDVPPLRWLIPKPLWTSNAEIIPLEKELEYMLPLWERITCPVRIIHAVNDRLVPFANVDFARRMLKNSTDLKIEVLPKGDHFILWSRQDVVRQAILDLLKGGQPR